MLDSVYQMRFLFCYFVFGMKTSSFLVCILCVIIGVKTFQLTKIRKPIVVHDVAKICKTLVVYRF